MRFCFWLLLAAILISSTPSWAQEAAQDSSSAIPAKRYFTDKDTSKAVSPISRNNDPAGHLWRVAGVTFLLLVVLVAGLGLYKKYVLRQAPGQSANIRVVARHTLGPKQSIMIVHIEGTKYALGATEHSINVIDNLGEAGPEEEAVMTQPGFNQIFKKIIQQK